MLKDFRIPGKASFIIGGQWGSEGKGAAAAWVAETLYKQGESFDAYTTNAGAQAGHTAILDGEKIVTFHLPTAAVIHYRLNVRDGRMFRGRPVFINAGAVIDPEVFLKEVRDYYDPAWVSIHPMAAVITPDCMATSRQPGSASEKRSGVQKGVSQAIARRVLRTGVVAKDCEELRPFVCGHSDAKGWVDDFLDNGGCSVLVEVPQGTSLSLAHSGFYPHVTSRDCTIMQAMNDAAIHPHRYGKAMMVLRTFPIRVGNIMSAGGEALGYSGSYYDDQEETSWDDIGVEAEITTVSKRVRRAFTFSKDQLVDSIQLVQPDHIFLTFTNYCDDDRLLAIADVVENVMARDGGVIYQWGPTSQEVGTYADMMAARKQARGL